MRLLHKPFNRSDFHGVHHIRGRFKLASTSKAEHEFGPVWALPADSEFWLRLRVSILVSCAERRCVAATDADATSVCTSGKVIETSFFVDAFALARGRRSLRRVFYLVPYPSWHFELRSGAFGDMLFFWPPHERLANQRCAGQGSTFKPKPDPSPTQSRAQAQGRARNFGEHLSPIDSTNCLE